MAQHIIVTDYNPIWAEMFESESEKIRWILGDNCVAIHHIGSTAVPNLAAKPIIDIMPIVKSLDAVDQVAAAFEEIGYEYLGEFGIPGRRYLRKGGDERTHQIHIFLNGDAKNIDRHIAFRDYMKTHDNERNEYAMLKMRLAQQFPYDIDGYCDGKEAFVKSREQKALEEYLHRRSEGI